MSRFFALSRTSHGMLDIAAPAFCALLWLGAFPPWQTIVLSLATAFAAYTAIYAINDLMGMKHDAEKLRGSAARTGFSVEASAHLHPLAREVLSVKSGAIWMGSWLVLALIGSYLLNPVIVLILVVAAILETIYCLLLKVTHYRTILSGAVKACGPIAAVFVVDASPSPYSLLLLFGWLFCWEIGGQNIPSDWNDTVEDRRVGARTIPIQLGPVKSGRLTLTALGLTVLGSCFLPLISPSRLGLPFVLASVLFGYLLLLRPAIRLWESKEGRLAARLFDSASYYPLAQLSLITLFLAAHFVGF